MPLLSAIVITRNEAANIGECLDSLAFCDERIVVDCGSTDGTAEVAREKGGAVKVAKVNVDENQSLSSKYNIRAIPALLFFKNGQLRDQIIGVTSKKDLLSRLEALA